MIPKEVLKQIRRIQISSTRVVTDVFAGQYHSVFKGKGMEFDEVREYFPGDDIRSIDWNVTARSGVPHIKKFVEERELTVMIMLDLSRSSVFGTADKTKRRLAAEVACVLAFAAAKNNDKIGFIGFTDDVEIFVPPRKGIKHILRIVREALYTEPKGHGTNISGAMEYLSKVMNRKTVTFLISDFLDEGFKKPLSVANKRHDLVAVTITDPVEMNLPDVGLAHFFDAETGQERLIDTSDKKFRDIYRENALKRAGERTRLFQSLNVDYVDLYTDKPFSNSLYAFFKKRGLRRK